MESLARACPPRFPSEEILEGEKTFDNSLVPEDIPDSNTEKEEASCFLIDSGLVWFERL